MESTNKDIKVFLQTCTPDQLENSVATLWLLPLYFPLKKIKNSSWRPSKLEAQEGFLLLVKVSYFITLFHELVATLITFNWHADGPLMCLYFGL